MQSPPIKNISNSGSKLVFKGKRKLASKQQSVLPQLPKHSLIEIQDEESNMDVTLRLLREEKTRKFHEMLQKRVKNPP